MAKSNEERKQEEEQEEVKQGKVKMSTDYGP